MGREPGGSTRSVCPLCGLLREGGGGTSQQRYQGPRPLRSPARALPVLLVPAVGLHPGSVVVGRQRRRDADRGAGRLGRSRRQGCREGQAEGGGVHCADSGEAAAPCGRRRRRLR